MTFDTWYETSQDHSRERFRQLVADGADVEQLEAFLNASFNAGYKQCVEEHLEADPVAWKHTMDDGLVVYYYTKDYLDPHVIALEPVYSMPPTRLPLTDKQIDMLTDRYLGRGTQRPQYQLYRAYVRAVEYAHGIK